ncbi:probable methyltransferase TARBP1 [Epargyreus clarus]|uniref:probable methyltransferase TARBP1 n=1 Tax=Epargyreus clarus TaxID=520877 RepID=UPI003C2D1840
MDSEELLALLDSLDLDEEIINTQMTKIMVRTTFTRKHLKNASRFLKYKLAVNKQEALDCSNEAEYEFAVKLIKDVTVDNIDQVCEITNLVLKLDPKSIVSKSEHLLQQILTDLELPKMQIVFELNDDPMSENDTPKVLLDLKLCSSILEAVISQQEKLSIPFLQIPLENIVFSVDDKVLTFFFISTIPHFNNGVVGFSILDRLWNCLKDAKEFKLVTLKALSCLADHYLPVADEAEKHADYSIAANSEFWEVVLFGLQSTDTAVRKRAIYLIKRALESLTGSQKDININTEEMVMVWDKKNEKMLKTMWDNFFILLDSLEEMQSNIVLPSLKLFESVKHLGHCWLSCAYNIGLQHDNAQVRLNCIMYRLDIKVESKAEALTLLNALNDINLYENVHDSKQLTTAIAQALDDKQSLLNILEAIPSVKWSPVPLYYLSDIVGDVVYPSLLLHVGHKRICTILNDILRIPCNSPVIKKAIFAHISNFIVNSCKGFIWEDYVSIYPQLHTETPITSYIMNPLAAHIKKNLYLTDCDKNGFAEIMSTTCENINIGLLYVSGHEQDGIPFFLSIINDKAANIVDICNRPYANKTQCLVDVNFLVNVFNKTFGRSEPYMVVINAAVMKQCKVILQYLSVLLANGGGLDVEGIITLFESLSCMPINDPELKEMLLQLYAHSSVFLNDQESPLDKKTFAISIINYICKTPLITGHHKNEMLSLEQYLRILKEIGKDMTKQGSGKLKNTFYEKACDIVLSYLSVEPNDNDIIDLFVFVEDVLDCGGYGCLKFILRIVNKILPKLIDNASVNFDLSLFLNQIWTQICELKSNREYITCVDDFVKLITQDILLMLPQHNSVVVCHYNILIELAVAKRMPLYFLVKHLSTKNVLKYDNMVNVLCNILLYAIVPKKDQRITENLTVELLSKMQGIMVPDMHVFSQHIQLLSITMLNKVTDVNKLNEVSERIMTEIDQMMKNKPRYYTNNTTHRKLLRALQNLLFIFLKTRRVEVKKTASWCMNLLRIPHDISVKTCILWYIALYIYSMDISINGELLHYLTVNGVPLISQFTIVYNVMRHKIHARTHYASETEFVLDFLLSNTMGPVFSVRLTAQYYAMMLFETGTIKKKINVEKYSSMIATLSKTLGELSLSKDNSFMNLRKDYFTQMFDIVGDLTVMFVFHSMQRRCESCNENVDTLFAMKIFNEIDDCVAIDGHDAFYVEWKSVHRWHAFQHYQGVATPGQSDAQDEASTIQKKYIPWRNMTDLEISEYRRNSKNISDLVVVASLVDRPPNLGGLARTCEVFGVMTYVIDSLRHLHDKQFQSLSVSADRWLNIEEVRPGRPLKEYLMRKKAEGYSIVAAEQTSNSIQLTEFKFPKKALVLLGHEKEGIPPNILPIMDHCVEIPQRGVIRSLNVHVTASIFVWEYIRQKGSSYVLK